MKDKRLQTEVSEQHILEPEYAREHGGKQILLHAQLQASGFYAKQGFQTCSEVFEEAGIPHIMMKADTQGVHHRKQDR